MDRFTAKSALLAGVELIRRRPLLILSWIALLLASAVFSAALRQLQTGMILAGVAAHQSRAAVVGPSLALIPVQTAVSVLVAAVIWVSAFRALLRPDRPAYLRLGREELMVSVVWLVTQLMASLPAIALQGILAFAGFTSWLVVSRWMISTFEVVGLFWSAVAAVWTFDRLRIAPFRCWTIARGRFWTLAGLFLGVSVVEILAKTLIRQETVALNHHVVFGRSTLESIVNPPVLLDIGAGMVVEALQVAFLAGMVASAYRAGAPRPQAAAAVSSVADASPS